MRISDWSSDVCSSDLDDVFDSGRSIRAFLAELKARCRYNMPRDIRIATVWYKPGRNVTDLAPHFHIHQTDRWLIFPHEIEGLTVKEIRRHKPEAAIILGEERMPADGCRLTPRSEQRGVGKEGA